MNKSKANQFHKNAYSFLNNGPISIQNHHWKAQNVSYHLDPQVLAWFFFQVGGLQFEIGELLDGVKATLIGFLSIILCKEVLKVAYQVTIISTQISNISSKTTISTIVRKHGTLKKSNPFPVKHFCLLFGQLSSFAECNQEILVTNLINLFAGMEVLCKFLQLDYSDPASQYIYIHHPTEVAMSHTLSVEGGLARTLPGVDQFHHVP